MKIIGYLRGIKNPERKQRYEVVASYGDYPVFVSCLVNKRGHNVGGMSFNFGVVPPPFKDSVRAKGDYCMKRAEGNISTVFIADPSGHFAFGDVQNPITKKCTNDALLFTISPDLKMVEVFVVEGKGHYGRLLCQELTEGRHDRLLDWIRSLAFVYANFA